MTSALSAPSPLPVVVSIATIPSRIGKMRATIDSLLNGELVPDRILIVRPEFCEWEQSGYQVPDFLNDENFCRGIVKVVITPKDWGPGNKILGAVNELESKCYLVLADDDVSYRPEFLSGLISAQTAEHDSSFSYYTYRAGGLRFGQGCDGYSFYSPHLEGITEFAQQNVLGTTLLYHDDLWIGFFLYTKGVRVKGLPPPVRGELVYKQLLPNDVLSAKTSGNFARARIFKDNLPRLIKDGGLRKRRRAALKVAQLYDLGAALANRLRGKVMRVVVRRGS